MAWHKKACNMWGADWNCLATPVGPEVRRFDSPGCSVQLLLPSCRVNLQTLSLQGPKSLWSLRFQIFFRLLKCSVLLVLREEVSLMHSAGPGLILSYVLPWCFNLVVCFSASDTPVYAATHTCTWRFQNGALSMTSHLSPWPDHCASFSNHWLLCGAVFQRSPLVVPLTSATPLL